jgi:O-antigen ligase
MSNVSGRAEGVARAALVALGFSIPISAAADGILSAVIVLSWLVAARFRDTARVVRDDPVAAIACLWFAAHALGALWSIGEERDVLRVVSKSAMFLLVPIAIAVLREPRHRAWALDAFICAIGLTAVLSSLRWLGAIPEDVPFLKSTSFSASVVFKYHLTQNLLVAFGAFLCAVRAQGADTPRRRYAWAAAACFAAINVLVMGDGRIGQVVLLVLLVYFALAFGNARAAAIAGVLVAAGGAAAYVVPGSTLHTRSSLAVSEAFDWRSDVQRSEPSSIGYRLDYYRASASIIARHPFFGVGTGGFPAAYEREVSGTRLAPTRNPHNEYLLRAVELGAMGVLLVIALFVVVWRQASRLAAADGVIARGLVITLAVAGLASSPLADHTETLLFVWLLGVLFAGRRAGARDVAPPAAQRDPGRSRAPAAPSL